MYTTNDLINDFEKMNEFVDSLRKVETKDFFTPIAAGKWTAAEIISHISYWDKYIREEMIPQMTHGADIKSVDFEVINQPAAAYALSGVSQNALLDKQLDERLKTIAVLRKMDEKQFWETFTLNGEENDQYSGYPHTIFNYIAAFTWHDNHHKAQLVAFLNSKDVTE